MSFSEFTTTIKAIDINEGSLKAAEFFYTWGTVPM